MIFSEGFGNSTILQHVSFYDSVPRKMPSRFALPILGLRSHAQRVRSLYKRSLRNLRCYYSMLTGYRIAAVELRDMFDRNRDIKDMRKAKRIVEEGRS